MILLHTVAYWTFSSAGYVITRVRWLGVTALLFLGQREMTAMAMTEPVAAAAAEPPAESAGGRFWCHECNAQVPTSVDEVSAEVCCNTCGGNFVEEIDEVNDAQREGFKQWY